MLSRRILPACTRRLRPRRHILFVDHARIAWVGARFATTKTRQRHPQTEAARSSATLNSPDMPSEESAPPNETKLQTNGPAEPASSVSVAGSGSTMFIHQFDTYKLVSALEKAGYSHKQAVALMKCLRALMVNGTEVAKSHYLSRGDLENVKPS